VTWFIQIGYYEIYNILHYLVIFVSAHTLEFIYKKSFTWGAKHN